MNLGAQEFKPQKLNSQTPEPGIPHSVAFNQVFPVDLSHFKPMSVLFIIYSRTLLFPIDPYRIFSIVYFIFSHLSRSLF